MQQTEFRANFERQAKSRQHGFRETSPTISKEARSPTDDTGRRYNHLLALDCEEDNLFPGIRGPEGGIDFFQQRNIIWWQGGGDASGGGRPTRNMASSQVACVNFLLPLAGIPGGLLSVLQSLDPDVRDVVDIQHEGQISPVEFEWVGIPHSLEGGRRRGAFETSVDAFMVAETSSGQRRAYLLEWKYVERYLRARPEYKGAGTEGKTRRSRYEQRFQGCFSSFDTTLVPDLDDFLYEPFFQLMRQRLLADRMVHDGELEVDQAKVVAVVPEENWGYRVVADGKTLTSPLLVQRFPHLETVEAIMRASLKDPRTQFDMVVPLVLLEGVERNLPDETVDWARYWRERYGV